MRTWLLEEDHPALTVDQLVARSRRERRSSASASSSPTTTGEPGRDGTVRLSDDVAQVEDVYGPPPAGPAWDGAVDSRGRARLAPRRRHSSSSSPTTATGRRAVRERRLRARPLGRALRARQVVADEGRGPTTAGHPGRIERLERLDPGFCSVLEEQPALGVVGRPRAGSRRTPRRRRAVPRPGPVRRGEEAISVIQPVPAPRTAGRGSAAVIGPPRRRRSSATALHHAVERLALFGRRVAHEALALLPLIRGGVEGSPVTPGTVWAGAGPTSAQAFDHVGALAGPDHAQPACLALERLGVAQLARRLRRRSFSRSSWATSALRCLDSDSVENHGTGLTYRASTPTRTKRTATRPTRSSGCGQRSSWRPLAVRIRHGQAASS